MAHILMKAYNAVFRNTLPSVDIDCGTFTDPTCEIDCGVFV